MWLVAALLGCAEDVGVIAGTIRVGPGEDAPPLAAGSVQVLTADGAPFDEAEIAADGRFEATAPLGLNLHVVIDGPDLVPSAFSGVMGQGTFEVPDGTLFAVSQEARAAMADTWGACDVGGTAMYGEIRLFGFVDDDGDNPLIAAATANAGSEGDAPIAACYLDPETGQWDPAAEQTGNTGQFAIFGLEPGINELEYGYDVGGGARMEATLRLFVPEGGVTPVIPAWIDLYVP